MTRNKLKFMGILVSSALLVACGEKNVEQAAVESSEAAIESTSEVTESAGATSETSDGGNIFSQMPKDYTFASGAGAWATSLELYEDGSFAGDYHDSDMGDSGDGYPNGTISVSILSPTDLKMQMSSLFMRRERLFPKYLKNACHGHLSVLLFPMWYLTAIM